MPARRIVATQGASTIRKCKECGNGIRCYQSGRFRAHFPNGKHTNPDMDGICPASGFSASEWRIEKAKREEEALVVSEFSNSWWVKEL